MRTTSYITTIDGTTWYYEQEGSGPHIVLIPDGLGECKMFDKPMSLIAADGFTVTTFDMPGFSRSHKAPPEAYQDITAQKLAKAVIGLLDALKIDVVTFWGSSSGGSTVLALAADYPERTRNGMPHEVPLRLIPNLSALRDHDDEWISKSLSESMPTVFCGNPTAWQELGDEALTRVWNNYPRWAHGYPHTLPLSSPRSKHDLTKRPLDWTVGASTPTELMMDNIVIGTKAGLDVGVIPGRHFPYVSDPEAFAKHVVDTTRKYL